jgi:hypothetical protein
MVEFNEGMQKTYEEVTKTLPPLTDDILLFDFIDFRDRALKQQKHRKKEGANEIGIVQKFLAEL